MENRNEVCWIQRFSNYKRALAKLSSMITYVQQEAESGNTTNSIQEEIHKQALIQSFEYTHELAWNVMKDYAKYQGNSDIGGSREATREVLQLHLIQEGDVWIEMIKSRNKISHAYNEEVAHQIYNSIIQHYQTAFVTFQGTMEKKRSGHQLNLL